MAEWVGDLVDWQRGARASLRRYAGEQDEPWQADAFRIARELVDLLDRDPVTRAELSALLHQGARLPATESGADALRGQLMAAYLSLNDFGFVPSKVTPAKLIVDPYGSLGVAIEIEPRPLQSWVSSQSSPFVAGAPADDAWWQALTFSGGAMLVPESATVSVGAPTHEQILEIVERTGRNGVKALLRVLPESVREILSFS